MVTNFDCFRVIDSLNVLIHKEIPVASAIKLHKTIKRIDEHIAIVRELANEIIEKYAEKDEGGNPKMDSKGNPVIAKANKEAYDAAYQELVECEWEDAPEIDPSWLGDIKVSTSLLMSLDPFLSETEN